MMILATLLILIIMKRKWQNVDFGSGNRGLALWIEKGLAVMAVLIHGIITPIYLYFVWPCLAQKITEFNKMILIVIIAAWSFGHLFWIIGRFSKFNYKNTMLRFGWVVFVLISTKFSGNWFDDFFCSRTVVANVETSPLPSPEKERENAPQLQIKKEPKKYQFRQPSGFPIDTLLMTGQKLTVKRTGSYCWNWGYDEDACKITQKGNFIFVEAFKDTALFRINATCDHSIGHRPGCIHVECDKAGYCKHSTVNGVKQKPGTAKLKNPLSGSNQGQSKSWIYKHTYTVVEREKMTLKTAEEVISCIGSKSWGDHYWDYQATPFSQPQLVLQKAGYGDTLKCYNSYKTTRLGSSSNWIEFYSTDSIWINKFGHWEKIGPREIPDENEWSVLEPEITRKETLNRLVYFRAYWKNDNPTVTILRINKRTKKVYE